MRRLLRHSARAVTAALVLLVAHGCGDSAGPGQTYRLRAFNGFALPTPLVPFGIIGSSSDVLQIAEGSITFDGNRVTEYLRMRCATPLPANATCHADARGTRRTGTFSADSGIVTFESIRGRVTFDGDEVLVQFGTVPDDRYPMSGMSFWSYAR